MSNRPMAHPPKSDTKQLAREQRRVRLATELRSNLSKRKEQARGRARPAAPSLEHLGADTGKDTEKDRPDARQAANADTRGPTGEVA